jgi:hypothetical protein
VARTVAGRQLSRNDCGRHSSGVTIEEACPWVLSSDFTNFDFESTVVTCLENASNRKHTREEHSKIAASPFSSAGDGNDTASEHFLRDRRAFSR